ncbi:MAG: hypothetical protein HXY36_06050 [Chloroflexi bacterium]|nr:hypothetical protein [Chloroflexota bacterium]
MPVVHDIPLSLKSGEVLRREGFMGYSKVRPEIRILIRELLAIVQKAHLLEPAIAYEIYTIIEIRQRQLFLAGKPLIPDLSLPSLLPQAKELAVAVCTIGPRLEKQVTDYTSQGEPLRGMLLDGIGSAAVDSLMEEACKLITSEALSRGYEASSPISPGMLGLPITEQWQLLKLVPAQEIGVSLTSAGIMVPRKSVSLVIGIGPRMAKWTRAEVCARCHLKKTCPYRISA